MFDLEYLINKDLTRFNIKGEVVRIIEEDYYFIIYTKYMDSILSYKLDINQLDAIIKNLKIEDLNKIKNILQERKIYELLHFTTLDNLDSILEYGLLSKEKLDKKNINYKINDYYRYDGLPNHVSTSISYPNYRYLYSLRQANKDKEYIILSINSCALLNLKENYFFETNAANNIYYPHTNFEKQKGSAAFERLFNDTVITGSRNPYIPDNCTTDPQAEAMIEDEIEQRDILTIYSNSRDYNTQNKIKSLALNANKDYIFGEKFYYPRTDYKSWRR